MAARDLNAAAKRCAQLARMSAKLEDESKTYGELEPGDTERYRQQSVDLHRKAFVLRLQARPDRSTPQRRPALRHALPRQRSRERRPQARRTARASSASRDGPSQQDDDPDLTSEWIGVRAASARLRVHLQRRAAAQRLAA